VNIFLLVRSSLTNETKGFFIGSSLRPLDPSSGSHCYIGRLFRKLYEFIKF
jgi:hypothetical protein